MPNAFIAAVIGSEKNTGSTRSTRSPEKVSFVFQRDQRLACAVVHCNLQRLGHSHRFRVTFAIELLLAGVPLERVSVMLGHGSIKVTEKHYSPWVRARQEQLEADVVKTWGQDPLILTSGKGSQRYTEILQDLFWR